MVLQNRNVSKPHSENTPPAKSTDVEARLPKAIREASRRRRARANGGSSVNKYAVEQAARRSRTRSPPQPLRLDMPGTFIQGDVEMKDVEEGVTPKKAVRTREIIALPRFLERPEFREIPVQNVGAVEPGLADTPIDYIRDGLEVEGPKMLQTLNFMKPVALSNVLPSEFSVSIPDATSDLPTHMFAVFGRQPFTNGPPKPIKQKVTLYPVHDIIFAAHCAHLPKLRPNRPEASDIKLPVVPVCLPSPQTFPILSSYLYTKRVDILLAALLPAPPQSISGPLGLTNVDESIPDDFFKAQKIAYAHKVAQTFTARAMLQNAMIINGVWRNVCALGVFDDRLWGAMDFAWDAILTALAVATGNPRAMIGEDAEEMRANAML